LTGCIPVRLDHVLSAPTDVASCAALLLHERARWSGRGRPTWYLVAVLILPLMAAWLACRQTPDVIGYVIYGSFVTAKMPCRSHDNNQVRRTPCYEVLTTFTGTCRVGRRISYCMTPNPLRFVLERALVRVTQDEVGDTFWRFVEVVASS
jgi:hypothetical protein